MADIIAVRMGSALELWGKPVDGKYVRMALTALKQDVAISLGIVEKGHMPPQIRIPFMLFNLITKNIISFLQRNIPGSKYELNTGYPKMVDGKRSIQNPVKFMMMIAQDGNIGMAFTGRINGEDVNTPVLWYEGPLDNLYTSRVSGDGEAVLYPIKPNVALAEWFDSARAVLLNTMVTFTTPVSSTRDTTASPPARSATSSGYKGNSTVSEEDFPF